MFDRQVPGRAQVVADLRRKLDALGRGVSWRVPTGSDGAPGQSGVAPAAGPPAAGVPEVELPAVGLPLGDGGRADAQTDGVLAAPRAMTAVLPQSGIPRGSIVSVCSTAQGGGALSLLLAMMAAPVDAWCAVVGLPHLGVLAASEMGVDLSRLGLIPDPGDDPWQVVSVLADGVDVIACGLLGDLPPARRRVLTGRLRTGGAVLLVAGRWPAADFVFTVCEVRWAGIGDGHGRLRDRELDVMVSGRRAGAATGALVTLDLRAGADGVIVGAVDLAAGLAGDDANGVAATAGAVVAKHPDTRADVG